MEEWKALPWKQFQRTVFRLQKRIYQASLRGDTRQVRQLQKLLSKSRAAKLLAVRKVTQDNQGKRTAGIDGVKSLTDNQRLRLSRRRSFRCAAKPLRRVWIPKPGSTEKRPLGIPVLRDRALQALVKLALEPEWEARFEPNSYGFRPGRSAHDAIGAIYNGINQRAKWVLDADLEQCFDRIDHARLLAKVATMPLFRRLLKGWLRAGVMEGEVFQPGAAGTPQGGVISPLLANIALHGMETVIQTHFRQKRISPTRLSPKATLIRYADDFVVLHEDRAVIEACREILADWLAPLGLAMKPAKTRVVHTRHHAPEHPAGFDFLGMSVRQFPVGRTHTGKSPRGIPLGYKTLIKPSRTAQQRHDRRLHEIVYWQRDSPQAALIRELNPVIRGWCTYYAGVVAKDVFSRLDYSLHHKLRRWPRVGTAASTNAASCTNTGDSNKAAGNSTRRKACGCGRTASTVLNDTSRWRAVAPPSMASGCTGAPGCGSTTAWTGAPVRCSNGRRGDVRGVSSASRTRMYSKRTTVYPEYAAERRSRRTCNCCTGTVMTKRQSRTAVWQPAVAVHNEEPCEVKVSRTVLKWQPGERFPG
nr:group II intron reverse transcriptase/maturase [Hymenobacter terricola]